jgi:hypothetical protein
VTGVQTCALPISFSTAARTVNIIHEAEPGDYILISSDSRAIVINSDLVPLKATRTTIGVETLQLPKKLELSKVLPAKIFENANKFKKSKIPARGSAFDIGEQVTII